MCRRVLTSASKMAESQSSEENPSTSPSKKDQPEKVPLIVRRYYDSLCKLIEAADPQSVSNKLYAKGIVGSAAHRALETLGVSKGQKSASVVDAFMLNLEGVAVREEQLSTLEIFLGVLANINNPCKQKATEIATGNDDRLFRIKGGRDSILLVSVYVVYSCWLSSTCHKSIATIVSH